MTAVEVLKLGIAHGARVVRFADDMRVHELTDAELDALRGRADGAGCALEARMQGFDPAMADRHAAIARRLGAGIVRIAHGAADAAADREVLVRELRAASRDAHGAGARIAVEDRLGFPSSDLVALLEAVDDDGIGVCLDVGNSICAGGWPQETARLLAPRTIALHLADRTFRPDPHGVGFHVEGAPFGQGDTDAAAVLAAPPDRPTSVIREHRLPWRGSPIVTTGAQRKWTPVGPRALRRVLAA